MLPPGYSESSGEFGVLKPSVRLQAIRERRCVVCVDSSASGRLPAVQAGAHSGRAELSGARRRLQSPPPHSQVATSSVRSRCVVLKCCSDVLNRALSGGRVLSRGGRALSSGGRFSHSAVSTDWTAVDGSSDRRRRARATPRRHSRCHPRRCRGRHRRVIKLL